MYPAVLSALLPGSGLGSWGLGVESSVCYVLKGMVR